MKARALSLAVVLVVAVFGALLFRDLERALRYGGEPVTLHEYRAYPGVPGVVHTTRVVQP